MEDVGSRGWDGGQPLPGRTTLQVDNKEKCRSLGAVTLLRRLGLLSH